MRRKMWLRFCAFVCCFCLIMPCFSSVIYASEMHVFNIGYSRVASSGPERLLYTYSIESSSAVYVYYCDEHQISSYPNGGGMTIYFLSDSPFSGKSGVVADSGNGSWPEATKPFTSSQDSLGGQLYFNAIDLLTIRSPISDLILPAGSIHCPCYSGGKYFWQEDDFVLGADPNGGSSSSIVYDSSIPAPANLRFESKSVGGFLGIGSKFEHKLSWSNGAATPPLYARISAVASTQATEDDVPFEDSTVSLLSAVKEGGYQADIGKYSVGTDELASKILPGTSLNKVLEYRVQFYRYVDDVLQVGPVSTIHIKTNIFGKYDGYTVTTEYPKDPDNPGASGGTDDFYDNDWSSDGSHYDEYDKDGNLIDSGTSEDDGGPIAKLLKSLKSIPQLIGSFFDSVNQLFAGIGNFPALLSRLFAFLPAEIIALVGLGISVVIVLRILGR